MSLDSKPLDFVEEADLQALVDDQVPEGKYIDYKESLPSNSDSDKKEFLADVSSFANAAGGHLIFGIEESSGLPSKLRGLHISDPDAEIRRLDNMMRDGIEPRIPSVSIRAVPLSTSRVAVVVRIPKSWASPHMVTFKGHSRFYSRNSAGKYPLDVAELRAAFALSETTAERIRNFRADRLARIVSGETPVPLDRGAKIVLQIIPLSAFDPGARLDVNSLLRDVSRLEPIYAYSWSNRLNFDGILTYAQSPKSNYAHTYLQVFRSGIIEAVEAYLLSNQEGKRIIPSVAYEKELLKAFPRFVSIQKQLGVEPPLFIMLSLLGVRGYTMAVNRSRFLGDEAHPIDRDALLVPEVMVESFEFDSAEILKPILDAVWNATGWPRSMNYDESGKWIGQ